METNWIAVAQDIAESARKKAAQDQEKLDRILKRAARESAEQIPAASR
jgi:hypothetical protein